MKARCNRGEQRQVEVAGDKTEGGKDANLHFLFQRLHAGARAGRLRGAIAAPHNKRHTEHTAGQKHASEPSETGAHASRSKQWMKKQCRESRKCRQRAHSAYLASSPSRLSTHSAVYMKLQRKTNKCRTNGSVHSSSAMRESGFVD
jgi:hypothetical protein